MASKDRWWDQYYVRYFVGTAVAIPLLILLAKAPAWGKDAATLCKPDWLNAAGIAAGGLAFCYLASTPILMLHTARAVFWKQLSWFRVAAAALAVFTAICAWLLLFPPTAEVNQRLLLIPFFAVTVAQVLALSPFIFGSGFSGCRNFYAAIAKYRATPATHSTPHSEFIESYRHLREHGNAVSIVTMEFVLAIALYATAGSLRSSALVVLAWLLPSAFAWFAGTWLEGSIDEPI